MGYSDTFAIPVSDTQAYRQFGNSVVVPIVEQLARSVIAALENPVRTTETRRQIHLDLK